MSRRFLYIVASVLTFVLTAAAQSSDTSGNGMLKGDYFIREILISGQSSSGAISSAASTMGVATFDGAGKYSYKGQGTNTTAPGMVTTQAFSGSYSAGANGLFEIQSLVDGAQISYGGISAIGPAAFVASATEGTSVDILVGVPAGGNASAASLKGPYTSGYIDFLNADVTMTRQATFSLNADGAGNFASVAVSGTAVNLGGTPTSQTVSGVTYTLGGQGSGTVAFGSAAPSQLISGTKTFYMSADGNILLGGNPAGYDMMVGIVALTGAASNATSSGEYYVAGVEDFLTSGPSAAHEIDGFYGSINATGQGTSITHNRFQSFAQTVFDYTYDSQYSVGSNGTFSDGALYQYSLGVGGKAFVATGMQGLYSLMVGFGTPQFSGPGVYLSPIGVVNAASFAPITNPIAPNEIIALFGSGLASSTASAPGLPLPTTLGGVQVTINNVPAPLFSVSPTQIEALVPQAITPASQVYYATIKVVNNNASSNAVTVYTSYTSPGVFSAGGNAVGPAAAQHADSSLITSANPAKIGETVVLYASGLGSVTPAVADGAAAPSSPPSKITDTDLVDFSGTAATITFAGLTPSLAGLYQLNATIGSGTSSGAVFADISTPDAYTSEATINVSGSGASSAGVSAISALGAPRQRSVRPPVSTFRANKKEGLTGRSRGSATQ
jgi:uncharacterized protein (TIGR03437 family)